jgi:hypothetical protein
MSPCYTLTSGATGITSGRVIGKCETTIATEWVNYVPTAMTHVTNSNALEIVKKLETQFYAQIKGMNSSKYNAQKTAISRVYAAAIISGSSSPTQVDRFASLANQVTCWIKETKAYDYGNRLDWLNTVVETVAADDYGLFFSIAEVTTDEAVTALLTEFTRSLTLASKYVCGDLAPPKITDPGPAVDQ